MTRFKVYNREYEVDFVFEQDQYGSLNPPRETRYFYRQYDDDEKWVVESVDGGREMYYASHEEAINSIYEGSK